VLDFRDLTSVSDTPHEKSNIGTLTAPVCVEFVKNQEAEALGSLHKLAFIGAGEDQFEHDVVCEENIRRVRDDLLALLVALLTCVAPKRYGPLAVWIAVTQELRKFLELTIGQGVHRVNDDSLDALASFVFEHVVNYGDDIAQTLPGPRPRRKDIVSTFAGCVNGVELMSM